MSTSPFSVSIYYTEAMPVRHCDDYYRYTDTRYYKTTNGLETKLLRAIDKDNWWRIDVYAANKLTATIFPQNNQHHGETMPGMNWNTITQLLGSGKVQTQLREKYR